MEVVGWVQVSHGICFLNRPKIDLNQLGNILEYYTVCIAKSCWLL